MKRLVRLYCAFQIFFSLLLWVPIFYEYQKRIGLSDGQIFAIQSIYYTAFCLLEIPTGVLADAWGRRVCLRVGSVILVFANLIPVLSPGYFQFLCHFVLIALSRSMISGASSAYLYEGLQGHGVSSAEYKRVEGNARSYALVAKVLTWPFVGFLMEWKLSLPYLLTAIASSIAIVCAFLLPEESRLAQGREELSARVEGVWSEVRKSFGQIGRLAASMPREPLILLLMVQGLAAFILPRILQINLFQPILSSKGVAVSSYGIWLAAASVFEALVSGYPMLKVTLRWLSEWNAVTVLTILMAVTLAVIPASAQLGTIASLMIFSLAAGMIFPVQKQLMNDAISSSVLASRHRATVLSMESIFDRAACAWVAAGIGIYISEGKMNQFLLFSALLAGVGIVVLSWVGRRIVPMSAASHSERF